MLDKLFKLAYKLDQKGLYEEAKAIDKVMKSLADRVGLKPTEMVSIANFLDEKGEIELASKLDKMLTKTIK